MAVISCKAIMITILQLFPPQNKDRSQDTAEHEGNRQRQRQERYFGRKYQHRLAAFLISHVHTHELHVHVMMFVYPEITKKCAIIYMLMRLAAPM